MDLHVFPTPIPPPACLPIPSHLKDKACMQQNSPIILSCRIWEPLILHFVPFFSPFSSPWQGFYLPSYILGVHIGTHLTGFCVFFCNMDNLRIFQIFNLFPVYLILSSISLSPLTFYCKQADRQGPYLQHFGLKHPYLNINFMVHKLHLPEYPRIQNILEYRTTNLFITL